MRAMIAALALLAGATGAGAAPYVACKMNATGGVLDCRKDCVAGTLMVNCQHKELGFAAYCCQSNHRVRPKPKIPTASKTSKTAD